MYTQIYILRFPKDTSDQPFIYRLVKEYDIEFNILKADILLQREGLMIIELKGSSKANVKEGLAWLVKMGIKVEKMAARRAEIKKKLAAVNKERLAYLAAERAKMPEDADLETLGRVMSSAVRDQLESSGFEMEK